MKAERITPVWIFNLRPSDVIVGGSNLAGRHGAGFAKVAKARFGALEGHPEGLQGQTYMIPTKDGRPKIDPFVKRSLALSEIKVYVNRFLQFARENPLLRFRVIEVGCGLAGFTPAQIAPLFAQALTIENITLPKSFWEEIPTNI